MKLKSIEVIREAMGEASAQFMSQECKGTEIIMPTEELERIAVETNNRLLQTIRKEVEGKKTDERQVAIFGDWQAVTYEDKMLVNAVLSDMLTLLTTLEEEVTK